MNGDRLTPEQQKAVAFVIGAMMILVAAIIISRTLFPYFLIGSLLSVIGLIVCGIIDIFFRDSSYNEDIFDYSSFYAGIILAIFFIGTFTTYTIGYGIGGTSFGQASLQVYSAITGAEQQVSDSMNKAINDTVESSCKTLTPQDCNTLRQSVSTFKTAQEVIDMADKLKSASEVVDKLTSK